MVRESESVQCAHGYWLEQDSCPGCDAATERPHPADPVVVRVLSTGRLGKRCRECGESSRAPQHTAARSARRTRPARNTAQQGARFEREVIAYLEELGYDCIRSAASKGAVDIVAVPPDVSSPPPMLFVQCKLSDPVISPAERTALLGLSVRGDALPIVAWRVDGRPWFRMLTGPGPKEWTEFLPAS